MDYQPLPLDLVASLAELPFPVYLQRDGRMVLYAMPGADLSTARGRTTVGLQVHVPASDAGAMRRLLVVLFARALESRSDPVADRGRRAVDFAVALLIPLFGRERSIDSEAFAAGQAAVDLLSAALAIDPALGRAIVTSHPPRPAPAKPGRQGGPLGASAEARRCAVRSLDGLACAIALAATLGPDRSGGDETTLHELGRGVAFRDLGLSRAGALGEMRPSGPIRGNSATDRGHPRLGVRLIADALGSQPVWTSLVAGHHERMDGSGYPAGRRGDDLPRAMRIAGLADTFASLVAPAAWGNIRAADEAIGVLRLGARARFGDDLVWALVRVLEAGQLLPLHRAGTAAATH
jgi:hypothetical protein